MSTSRLAKPSPGVLSRSVRGVGRGVLTLLRAGFVLMLLIIPVPVAALFHRLLDDSKRSHAAKVVKKEEEPG